MPMPRLRPISSPVTPSSPATVRGGSGETRMSSSSTSRASWPRYGAVPLTRCPECSRNKPLVRLVCKKEENGNYGREFVKCESRPQPGKIMKQCTYFKWMDAYIEKLQLDGLFDLGRGAIPKPGVGDFGTDGPATDRAVATTGDTELKGELKKMNKKLTQVIELKKQENIMHGVFYGCFIVMGLMYLVFMSRLN